MNCLSETGDPALADVAGGTKGEEASPLITQAKRGRDTACMDSPTAGTLFTVYRR